jgi:CRISPR-associated protein Cas5d
MRILEAKFWGDYALFTRPEFKAERVTYEVLTPSAARGLLESIFWKPEFFWVVDSIAVLNPIQRVSILRNEVKSRQTERVARKWANTGEGHYFADQDRTQRHSLILKDVAYIVRAHMQLKPHADKPVMAYEEQFLRRLNRGQCFQQPYFGCREFVAFFGSLDGTEEPINRTEDLGLMLRDLEFAPDPDGPMSFYQQTDRSGPQLQKGRAIAQFFQARLVKGVMQC